MTCHRGWAAQAQPARLICWGAAPRPRGRTAPAGGPAGPARTPRASACLRTALGFGERYRFALLQKLNTS